MAQRDCFEDLTGTTFGRLVVTRYAGRAGKRNQHAWTCTCDCGRECVRTGASLRGGSFSCGCARVEQRARANRTHGMFGTLTYRVWAKMIERCSSPKARGYEHYGGRGITVCERWRTSFQAFADDMGERPSRCYSIDRYPDKNGNYEPGNCRWATSVQQNRNRRNNTILAYAGESKCIAEWADQLGIPRMLISTRLQRGWTVERALGTAPLHHRQHNTVS